MWSGDVRETSPEGAGGMCLGRNGIKEAVRAGFGVLCWGVEQAGGGRVHRECLVLEHGITWAGNGDRAGSVGSDEQAVRVSFPMFFCPFSLTGCFCTSFSRIRFNSKKWVTLLKS